MTAPRPLFSILTAVYRPAPAELVACLESVDAQTDPSFEHIVVDDHSGDEAIREVLDAAETTPHRRVIRRATNGGIVAASNDALAAARGDYVVLLDHDDVLDPDALGAIREALARAGRDVDLVYSDHDLLRPDGRTAFPVFKPDFSLERLRNHNYITHLVALRRSTVVAVGGFRPGYDGAQDHDLLLRVVERRGAVVHVPRILAHWRQSAASVATATGNKPAAFEAGVRAVQDHLDRVGQRADVRAGAHDGVYRIHRRGPDEPCVSALLSVVAQPARGRVWGGERVFVHDAVRSIMATPDDSQIVEYVVTVDESTPPEVGRGLRQIVGDRLRLLRVAASAAPHECRRQAVDASTGSHLLFVDPRTEAVGAGCVEELLGVALQADVGLVGPALLQADGTIASAGLVVHREARDAFRGWPGEHPGPHRLLSVERECSAVSMSVALAARSVLDAVGVPGPGRRGDADFAASVRATGRRVVWTPHARWIDLTDDGAGPMPPDAMSRDAMPPDAMSRDLGAPEDPYYNPNLEPGRADWLERCGMTGAPPYVRLADGTTSWA